MRGAGDKLPLDTNNYNSLHFYPRWLDAVHVFIWKNALKPPSERMITAKIISTFVLFSLTFMLGIIPFGLLQLLRKQISNGRKYKIYIGYLNCFAGGVFFGTAVLHLYPESNELLESNIKYDYPVSGAVVGAGFFLLLFIEHAVGVLGHSHGAPEKDTGHENTVMTEIESSGDNKTNGDTSVTLTSFTNTSNGEPVDKVNGTAINSSGKDDEKPTVHIEIYTTNSLSKLRSFVLILAFSFHMVFEGLALGLQSTVAGVWTLLGILSLHKCIVAFSVGLQLSESLRELKPVVVSMVAFSLVAPIGVVVGYLIMEYGDNEGSKSIAAGILQGLATGTFFYITFFEILQKEFAGRHNLYKVLFTVLGFSAIVGLAFVSDQ